MKFDPIRSAQENYENPEMLFLSMGYKTLICCNKQTLLLLCQFPNSFVINAFHGSLSNVRNIVSCINEIMDG